MINSFVSSLKYFALFWAMDD